MSDALLRFALATEADEGFALKIQQILLADFLRRGQCSTREDVGKFTRDMGVIFADVFPAQHHVDGEFRRGQQTLTQHSNLSLSCAFGGARSSGAPSGTR